MKPFAPTLAALTLLSAAPFTAAQSAPTSIPEQPDNYKWLGDINGEKSMAWVRAENAVTTTRLEKFPQFSALEAESLKVRESPERIPYPVIRHGLVYNKWDDATHVRGIERRTTLDSYLTADPKWETVLDYDALDAAEKKSWVGHGLNCLEPEQEVCLLNLSNGGEDAVTLREFNLKTGKFVEGGFVSEHSKQDADWLDKDTLLIARDWGAGTMSPAGYALSLREWKRGTPLSSAKEIFRAQPTDNSVSGSVMRDLEGHKAVILSRWISFFENQWYILLPSGPAKLGLPLQSEIHGLFHNQLIVALQQDWTPEGSTTTYKQGSVLTLSLDTVNADPVHLKPSVLFAPTDREFEQQLTVTRHNILLTTLDHVQGRAYLYTPEKDGQWTRKQLPVPDNMAVGISWSSYTEDRFFLNLEGFLTPTSLWLGNAVDGSLKQVKSLKPQFDATDLTVEQLEATSKDGTRIPYFLVHKKDLKYDGTNPTLLEAYGGFLVSLTPEYNPILGKLWLEHGGVYVMANIRGGAEFGPAWHDAGLKTKRQHIYDDFYAVGQDLVTRKITTPARLGIEGASNGGLLMGVEMTQHPEAWKAVSIGVPLLDMLDFEHLSAGASWVGEYGSVSVPEEHAFLAHISPYNQLSKTVTYPEPFIWTTTKDDRVGPVHARKFAARMKEFGKPYLFYEIIEGGHGTGADNKQRAHFDAMMYSYLMSKIMD